MGLQRCLQKEGASEEKLAKVQELSDILFNICMSMILLLLFSHIICFSILDGVKASHDEIHLQPPHR